MNPMCSKLWECQGLLSLQLYVDLFRAFKLEERVTVGDRTSYGVSKSGRLTSMGFLNKKLKEELKRIGGA